MDLACYTLRPATAADQEALLRLHEAAFRPLVETRFPWDPEFQREVVDDSLERSQLIELPGADAPVGALIVDEHPEHLLLTRIQIHPAWQGRGLGRRIIGDLAARAAARGVPLRLSVWDNNRARRLYERLGFRETHREGHRVKMSLEPENS